MENFVINNSIKNILIIGDFNLNEFSITDYTLFKISTVLVSYINYLNLKQINNVNIYKLYC